MLTLHVSGYIEIDKDNVVWGRFNSETKTIEKVDVSGLDEQQVIEQFKTNKIFPYVERTIKAGGWNDIDLEVEYITEYGD